MADHAALKKLRFRRYRRRLARGRRESRAPKPRKPLTGRVRVELRRGETLAEEIMQGFV
jgi:hypothetical protein